MPMRNYITVHWMDEAGRTWSPPPVRVVDAGDAIRLWRDVRDRPTAHGVPRSAVAAWLDELHMESQSSSGRWFRRPVEGNQFPATLLWDRREAPERPAEGVRDWRAAVAEAADRRKADAA